MGFDLAFNPGQVAIAIITSYPKWYKGKLRSISHADKVRGDLALEFIKKATNSGYKLVIVDGKSSRSFRQILAEVPQIDFKKARVIKRSPKKRQAIKIASKIEGVKVIVLSEPEKISLLDDLGKIVKPILEDKADIVIPARIDNLFRSSYPEYMYESEIEGNKIYGEILRSNGFLSAEDQDLDMFFGPRALLNDKKIISLFMKRLHLNLDRVSFSYVFFDQEEYSDTQFFPIVLALKKKMRVKGIEVSFTYPKIQKENEEFGAKEIFIEKRKMQKMSLLIDLIHFLSFLERNPNSKMKMIA